MDKKELKKYELLIDSYKSARKNAHMHEQTSEVKEANQEYENAEELRYQIDCLLGDITEEGIRKLIHPLVMKFFDTYEDKEVFKNYIKELIYELQTIETIEERYWDMNSDCRDEFGKLEELCDKESVMEWVDRQIVPTIDDEVSLLGGDYWYRVIHDMKTFIYKKVKKNFEKNASNYEHYILPNRK